MADKEKYYIAIEGQLLEVNKEYMRFITKENVRSSILNKI